MAIIGLERFVCLFVRFFITPKLKKSDLHMDHGFLSTDTVLCVCCVF